MAGFLYYLPGFAQPILAADKLPEALRPQLADGSWTNAPQPGPDQGTGLVIAVCPESPAGGGREARCGYFPGEQTWMPIIEEGASGAVGANLSHWLGWERDAPPTPADLIRRKPIAGHLVALGDGNDWLIPAVHAPRTSIPQVLRRSLTAPGGGGWETEVLPEYAAVMAAAARWHDIVGGTETRFRENEWIDFAVQLLALHYRVGPREISALGLLRTNPEMLGSVVGAALDFPAIAAELAAQKKTGDIPPASS